MANAFYVTNAVAQGMLGSTGLTESIDAGTAAVIEIYDGSAPADADAAESNNMLARLTCAATAFSGLSDATGKARATFDTITSDTDADLTGTATHFRIKTQAGGSVICQGSVGTTGCDLNLNTVSITQHSTVAITSAYVDLPEGP